MAAADPSASAIAGAGRGLRIGLVGCGLWGRHILRDLRALGAEVEVVARSQASRDRARQGGAERIVESTGELGEVDGIVVATPETSHAATVAEALEHGQPVFAEKPLTVDPESAAGLAAAAPDRLFVMDKWRYHPGIEALRDLADSGELGPVRAITLKRLGWGNVHPTSDAIWHLIPHDISIALEILGFVPEPRLAVAEQLDSRPCGATAVLGDEPWVTIEASAASPRRLREVRVIFADGVAALPDSHATALAVAPAAAVGEPPHERPVSDRMPLERELEAFLGHLRGGPPPRSSAAEAARTVAIVGELRRLAGLPAASEEGV